MLHEKKLNWAEFQLTNFLTWKMNKKCFEIWSGKWSFTLIAYLKSLAISRIGNFTTFELHLNFSNNSRILNLVSGTMNPQLTRFGDTQVIYQGVPYFRSSSYKDRTYWRCSCARSHDCKARFQTIGIKILKPYLLHTHDIASPKDVKRQTL